MIRLEPVYRLIYGETSSFSFDLLDTEENREVIRHIKAGEHPGLVTVKTTRGTFSINLSAHVRFWSMELG